MLLVLRSCCEDRDIHGYTSTGDEIWWFPRSTRNDD